MNQTVIDLLFLTSCLGIILYLLRRGQKAKEEALRARLDQSERVRTIREFQEQIAQLNEGAKRAAQEARKAKEAYDEKYRKSKLSVISSDTPGNDSSQR